MADITLSSFPYLCGRKVSVAIGGLDCGDLTVGADGTLGVNFGSDTQGLLTAGYLTSISSPGGYGDAETNIVITDANNNLITVAVPVVVGYGFVAQGQRLRPDDEQSFKSQSGGGLGKQRRGFHWSMLLPLAGQFSVGCTFSAPSLYPVRLTKADRTTTLPATSGYTGVIEGSLADDHGFDTMLTWQIDRPVPFVVASVSTFLQGQEP